MSMRSLYDLRSMLCEELDELSKQKEFTRESLDIIFKMTGSIKNIDKIGMLESGGYSRDGDMRDYGRGNSYRGRDSMGRYSRSSETDRMKEQLERMMEESDNEDIREAIRQCASIIARQ